MRTNTEGIGRRTKAQTVMVRRAIWRDMPAVLNIERWSFKYPWSADDFANCLRGRNVTGQVAERGEQIVGFVVYELYKTRIEILNLAVDPSARGEGVGTAILDKLKGKLTAARRSRIFADARESNLGAQLFFRSQGFVAKEIVREPFEECGEDAYRFIFRKEWKTT